MTPQETKIVEMYQTLQMTIEEIAEEEDLEQLSIKACLLQYSPDYKSLVDPSWGGALNRDFSDIDLAEATRVLVTLASNAEDEHVRLRAAKYIRDDKKGRLDSVALFGKLNINVVMFNEQLEKARKAIKNVTPEIQQSIP